MYMLPNPFGSGEDFTAAAQRVSSMAVLETHTGAEPSSQISSFENDG